MGAIFQSLGRTVAAGVVLVIVLILAAGSGINYDHAWGAFVMDSAAGGKDEDDDEDYTRGDCASQRLENCAHFKTSVDVDLC